MEMTVSSQLDSRTSHRLQISWWVPQVESADMIALYITDPELNFTSPVFTLSPTSAVGWSHTPFSETYLDYSHIFTPVCLGYWVIYWRGHKSKRCRLVILYNLKKHYFMIDKTLKVVKQTVTNKTCFSNLLKYMPMDMDVFSALLLG